MKHVKTTILAVALSFCFAVLPQTYCGTEGVWIQMLGSGELDLDNNRSASAYLVWLEGTAVLLVDPGPGSSYRFDQGDAKFKDLDAILVTQTTIEHVGDLSNYIAGSFRAERSEPLRIFGPEAQNGYLALSEVVERMIGENGAFPHYQSALKSRKQLGYQVWTRDVPVATGKRWAQFGTERLSVAAIPVKHGDVPTLAWRVDLAGHAIVFANDFSNQRDVITDFADGADVLVVTHALPVGTRGALLDQFLLPEQIARIAHEAKVRFLVLGNRSWRTFGREVRTTEAIKPIFDGTIIFANDLECWGL